MSPQPNQPIEALIVELGPQPDPTTLPMTVDREPNLAPPRLVVDDLDPAGRGEGTDPTKQVNADLAPERSGQSNGGTDGQPVASSIEQPTGSLSLTEQSEDLFGSYAKILLGGEDERAHHMAFNDADVSGESASPFSLAASAVSFS